MPDDIPKRRPQPPQVDRRAASQAAIAARRARAAVKSSISDRTLSPVVVIERASGSARSAEGTLRVTEFLTTIPGIGPRKMNDALVALQISPSKRLGGLGRHQRERLIAFVNDLLRRQGREPQRLVVLAGPTAVGKGTVANYIRENYPDVTLSISATTRHPRPGERDGVNYYFVDDVEFDRMIRDNELLEYATVHNAYRYGTPRAPIDEALLAGQSVLLEIDLQGARQVRASMPEARLVFLLPPSWEELVRRLTVRGTEGPEEQKRRLATAKIELAAQDEFDERVINFTVPEAARKVVELMNV